MSEQLAIIKGVHFGVGDYGRVCMWFESYIQEHAAALQILSVDQAVELIAKFGVNHVDKLNGKTIWVETGNGMIKYLRGAVIG